MTQSERVPILIHETKIKSLLRGDQCLSVKAFLNVSVGGISRKKETEEESEYQRCSRNEQAPVDAR